MHGSPPASGTIPVFGGNNGGSSVAPMGEVGGYLSVGGVQGVVRHRKKVVEPTDNWHWGCIIHQRMIRQWPVDPPKSPCVGGAVARVGVHEVVHEVLVGVAVKTAQHVIIT